MVAGAAPQHATRTGERLARGRRARLGLTLLATLPRIAAGEGGVRQFLRHALRLLRAQGATRLVTWLIGAAAHQRRADAKGYRRWLGEQPPTTRPSAPTIAIVAVTGIAAERLPMFWQLALKSAAGCGMEVIFLTDAAAAAALDALGAGRGQSAARVETVPRVDAAAMIALARRHTGSSGVWAQRLTALFGPGYLPTTAAYPPTAGAVLYYGDEDGCDALGRPRQPFFKPGYSPDLLMHRDYVSGGMAMTPALLERLPEPSPAGHHGLALALAERAERVERLPVTVARRCDPGWLSPSPATPAPPDYLPRFLRDRYGPAVRVEPRAAGWTVSFGDGQAFVSVIVPTRDRLDLLAPCINGLYGSNAGDDFEVIVIDNGSEETATRRWLAAARERHPRFRVLPAPGEYNWSRLNNLGIRAARGDVLVFLNNDTAPRCEGWLRRLADVAMRPDVGFVGGLLLYGSGRIQHAGVALGFGGCAEHIYSGVPPTDGGHLFVPPTMPRNVAAVTGACMATSRRTLDAIGVFDEGYRVAGGDVEICIRTFRTGRLNVYLPDVELWHHESQSRGRVDPPADIAALKALVASVGEDPWYNPRLSLVSTYPSYPL